MLHRFYFNPKSPKGDFRHLLVYRMLVDKAPSGVWGEKNDIKSAILLKNKQSKVTFQLDLVCAVVAEQCN